MFLRMYIGKITNVMEHIPLGTNNSEARLEIPDS
jgi:hypothetical protein